MHRLNIHGMQKLQAGVCAGDWSMKQAAVAIQLSTLCNEINPMLY